MRKQECVTEKIAQRMKRKTGCSICSLVRCLVVLWVVFGMALLSSAEQFAPSRTGNYPDIWYRSFEGAEKVTDVFFSDLDVWGDEPVLILLNQETHRGTAMGFFSGKRRGIYTVERGTACTPLLISHHYYAGTKRELARRHMAPQDSCNVYGTETGDGGEIKIEELVTLGRGEIIDELVPEETRKKVHEDFKWEPWTSEYSEKLKKGHITFVSIGYTDTSCEPLAAHLVKRDKKGTIVWAKTFSRFYPDRESAPNADKDHCGVEKTRVISEAGPILLLPDETLLLVTLESVVRVRQTDGKTTPFSDRTFRGVDTADVLKIKLGLMQEQATVLRKCIEEGKPTKGFWGCGLYHNDEIDLERVQLDLIRRLYFK